MRAAGKTFQPGTGRGRLAIRDCITEERRSGRARAPSASGKGEPGLGGWGGPSLWFCETQGLTAQGVFTEMQKVKFLMLCLA